MKCVVISMILLIICQYFLNQISVDARPKEMKRFSWTFPIYNEHEDETFNELTKRRGAGWGKRNLILNNDKPYILHANLPRIRLDDK